MGWSKAVGWNPMNSEAPNLRYQIGSTNCSYPNKKSTRGMGGIWKRVVEPMLQLNYGTHRKGYNSYSIITLLWRGCFEAGGHLTPVPGIFVIPWGVLHLLLLSSSLILHSVYIEYLPLFCTREVPFLSFFFLAKPFVWGRWINGAS